MNEQTVKPESHYWDVVFAADCPVFVSRTIEAPNLAAALAQARKIGREALDADELDVGYEWAVEHRVVSVHGIQEQALDEVPADDAKPGPVTHLAAVLGVLARLVPDDAPVTERDRTIVSDALHTVDLTHNGRDGPGREHFACSAFAPDRDREPQAADAARTQ